HGYRNVTCMFGPDGLTADHLAAIKEFGIRRVLTSCEPVGRRLLEAGLDCFLVRFPSGLDANAYALRVNDPAHALGAVLRKAEWRGKGGTATPPTAPVAVVVTQGPSEAEPAEREADGSEDVEQVEHRSPDAGAPGALVEAREVETTRGEEAVPTPEIGCITT